MRQELSFETSPRSDTEAPSIQCQLVCVQYTVDAGDTDFHLNTFLYILIQVYSFLQITAIFCGLRPHWVRNSVVVEGDFCCIFSLNIITCK